VATLGSTHMPPLATSLVNTQAVDLLAAWITLSPTIQLVNVSSLPDGNIQFTLSGTSGWTNIVQATASLTTPAWVNLATNVFDINGLTLFVDTDATNHPTRFYRAVTP
jgi:hypothetical protein